MKQEPGAQKTRGRLELIGVSESQCFNCFQKQALQVQGLPSPETCRFDTYIPEASLPVEKKRFEEFDPSTVLVAEVDIEKEVLVASKEH